MQVIEIHQPLDPRIQPYREVRERDLVGRQGRFIAEGEVVLRHLIDPATHFVPESLLIAAHRLDGARAWLSTVGEDVPVYVAPQPVMDAIAGFPLHRGLLGIGLRGPEREPDALLGALGPEARVLALMGIGNHDNMGGLFRNAAAFGAGAVLMDLHCCDPLYRKAIRVSVGAALRVPFVRMDGEAMLAALRAHGFEVLALSPSGDEVLADVRAQGRCALLLGSEGPGLKPDVLARTRTVRIPMSGGFDSLNVAVTGALALHQLARHG